MGHKVIYIGTDYLDPEHHNGGSQRGRAIVRELQKIDPAVQILSFPKMFPSFRGREKRLARFWAFLMGYRGRNHQIFRFLRPKHVWRAFKKIRTAVSKCDDQSMILLDHPWGYLALEGWLDDLGVRPKIIYASQNVEHLYLKDAAPADRQQLACDLSRGPEIDLVQAADLVIATTQPDADFFRQHKHPEQVVQIGNGCERRTSNKDLTDAGSPGFNESLPEKFLFYIGSAHVPNFIGLETCLEQLTEQTGIQLVIAGKICEMLRRRKSFLADLACVSLLGTVSDRQMDWLYRSCCGVIIPETSGSGSNIKCAEALMSGKPVLSTQYGLRGYEAFCESPGVWVAESPKHFVDLMQKLFEESGESVPLAAFNRGNSLQWEEVMKPMLPAIAAIDRDNLQKVA